MRVLFCKVASMKYYKGTCDEDTPMNGGSYVTENGTGLEEYNFYPFLAKDKKMYCFGFVETTSRLGIQKNLCIERIDGCEQDGKNDVVENILVIWCATTDRNETSVVGWYNNANVYRKYQKMELDVQTINKIGIDNQKYNVMAYAKNVVLLPRDTRDKWIWSIPLSNKNHCYGFGKSLIWYARETEAQPFVSRLFENIHNYKGANWLQKYPQY